MRRQRSMPWIHRYSRPLMAGIATIGAAITAYLTAVKLSQGTAVCPIEGCDIVLSSPYAYVFGLPLSLFGFLGYLSMIVFAVAPLLVNPSEQKSLRSKLESWTGLFLFAGSTAMTIFSGYLMYVLAVDIKAACIYCIVSALFAASLFVLALIGREWDDIGQLFFIGILVSMLVLISSLALYADVNNLGTARETSMNTTTSSGTSEIALARHLKIVGAKMYGSFTCDRCQAQKESFGKEAAQIINYIECNPQGKNARRDLCEAAKIQGTPTWEINGKFYQGQKSLQELADLSGYQGTREFKNP
ncbi:vitamin K epoxide reductase family protein [Tychonema sp. LEGE 07203]|uniref:vitamin K epoxide reductase family protein n=1 Tax=Tychonema sp. LEGE 07203 TaxID=1828671 RepID=UPI001881C797|nr:vitamin K epoxide reductase family protein [Tychonema sp. LEGE 07203]MBE9096803.1 vitamin K epoxide reductase family protein [Tychonema sp. LEGE 07203]